MNIGYEPDNLKVYVFSKPIDMRKQMDGLALLVEAVYKMDPCEKALFVFTNKKQNRLKALRWDESGFVVYYKRLESGSFRIPRPENADNGKLEISAHDMRRLVYGLEMECVLKNRQFISGFR